MTLSNDSDREKYGRHLREVIEQMKTLPASEQQSQVLRAASPGEQS